jgi:hypothetical protein
VVGEGDIATGALALSKARYAVTRRVEHGGAIGTWDAFGTASWSQSCSA